MRNHLLLAILTTAAAVAGAVAFSPPTTAQTANADLVIVALEAVDPTFDSAGPTSVIATVQNNGSGATGVPGGNFVRFRYDRDDQPLTGGATSDQPFNTTSSLPPGKSTQVRVEWTPTTDQVGPGRIIAIVDSPWESQSARTNNRFEVPVFVAHHNATLELVDDKSRTAFPGQATPYRANITNTGNVNTTFNLTVQGRPEDPDDADPEDWELPDGWTGDASPASLRLVPGESRTIVALLRPPPDATSIDRANATLNASAQVPARNNFTLTLPATRVTTKLPAGFSRSVAIAPVNVSSFVGPDPGNGTVEWTLVNDGSHADAYNLTPRVEGDLADSLLAHAPSIVALDPSEAANLPIRVEVLEPVEVGTTGRLVVDVRSVNADVTEKPVTATHELVASGPDLVVVALNVADPVYAANAVAPIGITIANHGNQVSPATNATLVAKRAGFAASTMVVKLPAVMPGAEMNVSVPFPVADLLGAYVVEATANEPAAYNETTRENNLAMANLHVRDGALTVSPASGIGIEPGGYVRLVRPPHLFEAQNRGNAGEVVNVEITSANGWISETRTLTIEAGSRAGISVELRVPSWPGMPSDTVTVTARLANLSEVTASNSTTIAIVDEDPPEMLDVDLPTNATATQPLNTTVRLRDAIGVAEAWFVVELPNGGQTRVDLGRGDEGSPVDGVSFSGTLTFEQLGTHKLRLHAKDRGTSNNTYIDPDPRIVAVTYDQRPTLGLLSPTSGAVRAGVPIELLIEDPVGLASVNVTVDGYEMPMRADKTLDTTAWNEGSHIIELAAANRYGLDNTTSFSITIDNTPPVVEEVDLRPGQPRPGAPMTIEALVTGAPQLVEAHITSEGKRFTTVELAPRGDDRFTGAVTLPAGAYEIAVVATDAAGNKAGLPEPRPVVVDAGTPGPGWLAVALTIAAVAFQRADPRRRRDP